LRLEHERKAASSSGSADATTSGERDRRLMEVEAERDALRRRADEERAAWMREREQLGAELAERARAAVARNGHDVGGAIARELEALETELRTEAGRLDAVAHAAADLGASPLPADETKSRLETTLGNYRERAGRLRDDLEGVRRRLDALSPSEIAGFLEELGEDLAELGK
jgi:chromosome segregation ATPase